MYLGDMMKKLLIWIFIALVSGAILGKYTFDKYENIEVKNTISFNNEVYMLEYGVYDNLVDMTEDVDDVERYIYIEEDGKVGVYIAITTTKDTCLRIKKIYDQKGIETKIVKINVPNDEFIQNLNEYEKLLISASDDASLLIIEKEILSCYESLMVSDE